MTDTLPSKTVKYHLLGFFLLTILAYRTVFFSDLTIGHNWDWIVPYFPSQMTELLKYGQYLWYEYALGTSVSVAHTSAVIYFIMALFGKLGLGGAAFTKVLLFYVSFISCTAFYFLIRFLLTTVLEQKNKQQYVLWAAFIGGLYYGFSPYLFNELNGGAISKLFTYPLIPLFLLYALKYIYDADYLTPRLLFASALLVLVASALQNLVLASVCLLLLTSLVSILRKNINPFIRLTLIYIVYLLFSSYWLLPLLSTFNYTVTEFVNKELFNASTITYNVPQWYEILIGAGYFREFFTYSSSVLLRPHLFLVVSILISITLAGIYFARHYSRPLYLATQLFALYYLLAIIPAVGARPPFGRVVLWLYQNIGLLNLFRSPQHFILQVTLAFALLLAVCCYVVISTVKQKHKGYFVAGTFLLLIVLLNGYFLRGDLASAHFKKFRSAGNHVDFFKYPNVYSDLLELVAKDKTAVNAAFLPSGYSPYYMKNEYQHYGQGGDPFLLSFPKPYIANTSIRSTTGLQLIEKFEDRINSIGFDSDAQRYLAMLGAKYLILRDDVIVNFGNYSLLDSFPFVKKSLDTVSQPKTYEHLNLYEFPTSPRIFATTNTKFVTNQPNNDIDFEKVLRLTADNSVLIQSTSVQGSTPNGAIYTIPKYRTENELFIEVRHAGTYTATTVSQPKLNKLASVQITNVDCATQEQLSDSKSYVLNLLTTTGVYFDDGCYILDVSEINHVLLYSTKSSQLATEIPQYNLTVPSTAIEFPLNHTAHNYHLTFNYNSSKGELSDIFIWAKVCGDPKTYVITNSTDACAYDLLPAKAELTEKSYSGYFKISGNELHSPKGVLFHTDAKVSVESLNLYELISPIDYFTFVDIDVQDKSSSSEYIPVDFARINPTKYVVNLPTGLTEPFLLYFGQNYDSSWILKKNTYSDYLGEELYNYIPYSSKEYSSTCTECSLEMDFSKGTGTHVVTNLFANGWLLDPTALGYSNNLILEFYPQQFFVFGKYLSLFFVSSFIVLLGVKKWRKR